MLADTLKTGFLASQLIHGFCGRTFLSDKHQQHVFHEEMTKIAVDFYTHLIGLCLLLRSILQK